MNNNEFNKDPQNDSNEVPVSLNDLSKIPEIENNYIRGLVLGCIFSMGGVAVWIILGLIGFYASIAAYLIGLFFYLGLRKGPVKITKKTLIMITIYSIVVSLLANYISFAIDVMRSIRENGYESSFLISLFIDTPYNLTTNSEIFNIFLRNNALALIFACLGAYSIYKYIVNKNR